MTGGSRLRAHTAVAFHGHRVKGSSDGLESDVEGRIYATNYEQGAVIAREPDGSWREVVHGRDHLFADTLAVAGDGFLYYTVNQLHRQPAMQPDGEDRREPPYAVMRTRIDAAPVRLVHCGPGALAWPARWPAASARASAPR